MIGRANQLRIGCVKYLNARPLIRGWEGPVEFDHPSALCQKLDAGELDVALVSSFEFLRNPSYAIVDDVAIGADGPVYSVFVAHRGELEKVNAIALDPASTTSVNLLRCILAERKLRPQLLAAASNEQYDAQLIIGDQAIRFRVEHEHDYVFCDLAEEWRRLTALPFVFALWLVRPEIPNAQEIADRLRQLRDTNMCSLEPIIAEQREVSANFCRRYYCEYLRFGFGGREKQGLMLFHSLCAKHGILPPGELELRLI